MPASTTERTFIRLKAGVTVDLLPDDVLDAIFAVAEEEYATYSRKVIKQYALVLLLSDLHMKAVANSEKITQNEYSEDTTSKPRELRARLDEAQAKLDEYEMDESKPAARIMKNKRRANGHKANPYGRLS